MPEGIPAYVLVARIGSILGMSFALAIGLLLLIGGFWLAALVAFVAFFPSLGVMIVAERKAAADDRRRRAEARPNLEV